MMIAIVNVNCILFVCLFVVKVIETMAKEEIALNTKQIGEVMDLLSKEEIMEELEKDVEREEKEILLDSSKEVEKK